MARGKLERTKLKEAVVTAVRETTAYQVAGQILEQSKAKAHEKKPLTESFREHIGKWLDRVDPIELAAIIASTYVVHETIIGTEKLYTGVLNFAALHDKDNPARQPISWLETLAIDIASFGWVPIINAITGNTGDQSSMPAPTVNELFVWAVSFIAAYLIVKNAGVIASTVLSLPSILTLLGILA